MELLMLLLMVVHRGMEVGHLERRHVMMLLVLLLLLGSGNGGRHCDAQRQ